MKRTEKKENTPKTQLEKFKHLERVNENLRLLCKKFDLVINL